MILDDAGHRATDLLVPILVAGVERRQVGAIGQALLAIQTEIAPAPEQQLGARGASPLPDRRAEEIEQTPDKVTRYFRGPEWTAG